jgi:hypothetical protein
MTMTSWQKLFGFGACAALFAAACTVSSGDDTDDEVTTGIGGTGGDGGNGGSGGSGGNTTTGTTTTTTTATTTTTGSGGMGGSGGSGGTGGSGEEVHCLDDASGELPGEVVSCETEVDNCCARCMAVNCCEEYSECFAVDPFNICGGSSDDDSEIAVFIDCMLQIGVDEGGSTPGLEEDSDFDTCMAKATEYVSSPYCDNSTISVGGS